MFFSVSLRDILLTPGQAKKTLSEYKIRTKYTVYVMYTNI